MNELIVTGLTTHQRRIKRAQGAIIFIYKGVDFWREPSPEELFIFLYDQKPDIALTGLSTAQVLLGRPLTFPLHLVSSSRLPMSPYFVAHRTRDRTTFFSDTYPSQTPLAAAQFLDDDSLTIQLLESAYAGRTGIQKLENHSRSLRRIPGRTKELLHQAIIGTDSGAERKVARALQAHGLEVRCNYLIGEYYWDIAIPKLRVAVEINGYSYHSELKDIMRDAWKNNDGALRGWLTLRYTGSCVKHEFDHVIEQIVTARDPDFDSPRHRLVGTWHGFLKR